MKRFVIATVIAVLAVCAAGFGYFRFTNACDSLEADARVLQESVEDEARYEEAAAELTETWSHEKPILDMLCPHGYTEELDAHIRLLPIQTQTASAKEKEIYLAELQAMLLQLREAEKPSLQNIL